MRAEALIMIRVYLTESEHRARELLRYLHDARVRGATLMRGVSGFGQSGRWHEASWSDVVGDLPLILEFADEAARVDAVLPELLRQTKPRHVLRFAVEAMLPD